MNKIVIDGVEYAPVEAAGDRAVVVVNSGWTGDGGNFFFELINGGKYRRSATTQGSASGASTPPLTLS